MPPSPMLPSSPQHSSPIPRRSPAKPRLFVHDPNIYKQFKRQESESEVTPIRGDSFDGFNYSNHASPLAMHQPNPAAKPPLGSPQPVAIDIPSPGTWDPQLERFLRPMEPDEGVCQCVMLRSGCGKKLSLLLEHGNIPLLDARRQGKHFEITTAEGSPVAHVNKLEGTTYALVADSSRTGPYGGRLELARFALSEVELSDVPSKPRLNSVEMILGAAPPLGIPGGAVYASLARPAGDLAAALGSEAAPMPSLVRVRARQPLWQESKQLLTLDYPPGRAVEASVQNFQLCSEAEAPAVVLVHGLMKEEGGVDHFSLDYCAPLSALHAFAAVLAVQNWA